MRRNVKKINFGLLISILIIVAIQLVIGINFKDFDYSWEIELLCYLPVCILVSKLIDKITNNRINNLIENGVLIKTNYVKTKKIIRDLSSDRRYGHNYINQYIVYTEGTNPTNHKLMTFKSEEIWEDFDLYMQNNGMRTIDVYVDSKNPRKYYMDLRFLNEKDNLNINDIKSN